MTDSPKPYVLQAGQGAPGFDESVKASRISTGGSLTLIESRTTGGAPMHVHSRDDEYFYVVEGSIVVNIGGEVFEAGPRAFVFLPRGIPHSWDVTSSTATILMITTPAGLEEFLGEYHTAASKEDKDRIAAQHGITWTTQ